MTDEDLAALPLRERKKALTKAAILEAAQTLFEQRGFDAVTVAEIADAANVSVKTLFVYFRSKEDLAFSDTTLIDAVLAAIRDPEAPPPATAVAAVLTDRLDHSGHGPIEGIEGFHRGYTESESLQSGLARVWSRYEDQVTAALAEREGTAPTPDDRFQAIGLVGLIRTLTAPEVRTMIADLDETDARDALTAWLSAAAGQATLLYRAPVEQG